MAARNRAARNLSRIFQLGGRRLAQGTHSRAARHSEPARTLPGRMGNMAGARKQAMRELQEVQKIFNERNLLEQDRNRLNPSQREVFDLRTIFFQALAEGQVRDFRDFRAYLERWLVETHQNPGAAAYAPKAVENLVRSFNPQQRQALEKRFRNLAILARGGDPYD